MMPFAIILFLILFSGALGSLVFQLAGYRDDRSFTSWFFRALAGLTILVLLYALIKSAGRTTMLLALIPAFVLWKNSAREKISFDWKMLLPHWSVALLVAGLAGGVAFFLMHFFETTTLQEDSGNYLKIAESLKLTGQENTRHFRNVFSTAFHGMEPYHYYEMWLAAFVMSLPGELVSNLDALRIVAYGIILVLVIIGLVAVFENSGIRKFQPQHLVLAILFLLFVPNIAQLFFNYEKHFSYSIECNPLVRLNFRTYWLFLLPVLVLALRREYFRSLVLMLLLPVISFTTAPAVCGAVFLFVLLNRWTKIYSREENRRLFFLLAAFGVLLLAMLSVFKIKAVGSLYSYNLSYIIGYFKASWKAIAGMIIMEAVNILIVFGPFFLLVLLLQRSLAGVKRFFREHRFLLLLALLMNLSGVVLFQLASFMNNAYQFTFIGFCLLALLIPVFAKNSLEENTPVMKRFVVNGVLIFYCLFSGYRLLEIKRDYLFAGQEVYSKGGYHAYDPFYLERLKTLTDERPGAFIGDSAYYNKMYYSKRLPDFYFPGSVYYLFASHNNSYAFCLSDTAAINYGYNGTERDRIFLRSAIVSSLFHHDYFMKPGLSLGEKQLAAIRKYHLRYLLLTPGVKPDEAWTSEISKIYTDPVTQESLVVLK